MVYQKIFIERPTFLSQNMHSIFRRCALFLVIATYSLFHMRHFISAHLLLRCCIISRTNSTDIARDNNLTIGTIRHAYTRCLYLVPHINTVYFVMPLTFFMHTSCFKSKFN